MMQTESTVGSFRSGYRLHGILNLKERVTNNVCHQMDDIIDDSIFQIAQQY